MAAFAFAAAISLAAAAPRGGIVSLNLCTDELVMLVADPAAIRSVSYLSHLREESPLWRRARRYRANDGSMLAAAAMQPAVVVTMGTGGRDRARLARAVGARLLELPYAQTLDDVVANLRRVGTATGGAARAKRIAALMRQAAATAPVGARDAMWVDGAGHTLSPGAVGAAWLRLVGLRQRAVPGDRVPLETMLTKPPAVLVASRYRAGQMSSAIAWARHPAARRARAGQRIDTDGRRWTCAGPTLLPEILRLRRLAGG